MWSRIPQTNSWLFYAQSEVSTITCINPEQSFNIEISRTGMLTISSKCEIYNLGSIMLAIDNDKEIDSDLVPSGSMNNLIFTLSIILDDLIPQSITNTNLLKTFDSLARYAISTNNLCHNNSKALIIFRPEIHFVIIYVIVIIIVILVVVILRENKIRMYGPDLAETQADQDNESEI